MIKDLSRGDTDYIKKHLTGARSFQEKEFKSKINLDVYKAYYSGDDYAHDIANQIYGEDEYISLNKIFPATNRVIPSLYFQNPKIQFTAKKDATDFSAKILTAAINYDYREMKIKQENQRIILDAWYCGFGACKEGHQTNFAYKAQEKGLMSKIKGAVGVPDKEEKIIDYIEYEGPFVRRLNPFHVLRDPKQPAGKDRCIWLYYKKTLEDIVSSDVYEYDSQFITRFGSKDQREVELDIYEGWLRTRKGLYIVTLCDGYQDPIRYELSSWKGDNFPISFLSFAEINDEHYPPSFMKVTSKQQKHINYLATLQFNVINKFRNQIGINENSLSEEGKRNIDANVIGGIIKFKQPITGNIGPITSAPIPAELFNVMEIMQSNLQECLVVAGLRSGNAQNEPTLGQDQIKEFGNTIGLSGMQDKVREFVIDQATKLAQMRKQYSTAPSLVPIVGTDIVNPVTGQLITDEWLEFGTAGNPITLKDAIAGDHDVEVDIKSAQKPDDAMKLKLFGDMANILMTSPAVNQMLATEKKKINWGKFIQGWLDAYKEYIPNANTFIVSMSQQEIAEAAQKKKQVEAAQIQDMQNIQGQNQLDQQNKKMQIEKGMQEMDIKDVEAMANVGGTNGKP